VCSSTGHAACPSPHGDLSDGQPPPAATARSRRPRWGANGYATTALVTGILGAALGTIPVSLTCGMLGLRRARRAGRGAPGRVRCWLGIGCALCWAALAGYLVPHLVAAADPGCVAYKGSVLVAYQRVINDLTVNANDATTARDVRAAVRQLDRAAAHSRNRAASASLGTLSAQLHTVLAAVSARQPVPRADLQELNRDSALADGACGTVHL
jgi:hypothetical protein